MDRLPLLLLAFLLGLIGFKQVTNCFSRWEIKRRKQCKNDTGWVDAYYPDVSSGDRLFAISIVRKVGEFLEVPHLALRPADTICCTDETWDWLTTFLTIELEEAIGRSLHPDECDAAREWKTLDDVLRGVLRIKQAETKD